MPEFTTAKWGCMIEGCRQLRSILQPNATGRPGTSPLERLMARCNSLYCGTLSTENGTRAHPHKERIISLVGILASGVLQAGVFAMCDLWDGSYDSFFELCKSPSRFGAFPEPHLRHMLAEQVARDSTYYTRALANPVRCL